MWRDPSAWFYPSFGPFVPGHYPDYFSRALRPRPGRPRSGSSGAATLALVLAVLRPAFLPAGVASLAERLLPALVLGVGLVGLVVLADGLLGSPTVFAPGFLPPNEMPARPRGPRRRRPYRLRIQFGRTAGSPQQPGSPEPPPAATRAMSSFPAALGEAVKARSRRIGACA